jgi:hypothetical protein
MVVMNALTNIFATPPADLNDRPFANQNPPANTPLATLTATARELALADQRLKRAEALVEAIRTRRTRLATKVLPELLDSAQTDTVGLPSMGVDVIVEPFYHAAIRADWPADKRQTAFDHLDALGGGDLVKAELTVSFQKEHLSYAKKLLDKLRDVLSRDQIEAPSGLNMSVHWGSLTSWMRAEIERPIDEHAMASNTPRLDPELIGGVVMRMAKVVPRVERKVRGRGKKK